MSDDTSKPHAFDWGLTPRTPADDAETPEPPKDPFAYLTGQPSAPVPPAAAPYSPPPLVPPAQQTPPQPTPSQHPPAAPPAPEPASWDQPTQAFEVTRPNSWEAPTVAYRPPSQYPDAAPPPLVDPPTVAVPPRLPWEAPAPAAGLAGATEALAPQPFTTPAPVAESAEGIDSLFGEHRFQEYADEPLLAPPPRREVRAPRSSDPGAGLSRTQRVLIGVAGGLLAVLVLILVFVLGSKLGASSATPATTTPNTGSTAPAAVDGPGTYPWTALAGGECVDPFTSAWETEFTVVDCTEPHAAQLVAVGTFDDTTYPGDAALADEAATACTAPKVIDYAAAAEFTNLQLQSSYAPDQASWDAGDHGYLCFVTLASGEPLTASVAR